MGLDKVPGVMITLLVIVAVVLVTFVVSAKLGDVATATAGENSYAANATAQLEAGMYNAIEGADDWGSLIGIGILVAIVFGFILGGLYLQKRGYI